MTEQSHEGLSAEAESRKVNLLVEKYKDRLGGFDVLPVADVGFILQSQKLCPQEGSDWVFFDYDDTLRGTAETKHKRLSLYKEYARGLQIEADDSVLESVMSLTDEFSRWEDKEGRGKTYHSNVHMASLSWATDRLSELSERQRNGEEIHFDQEIEKLRGTFERIKRGDEVSDPEDPFHFQTLQTGERKLILKSKFPFTEGIESVFVDSMVNPPDYSETIQAASHLGRPEDSVERLNVGVFTYGEPYFQLLKVLELMEQNPEFPVSQVWLTRVKKGKFIEKLVKTGVLQKTEASYVFGDSPHTVIVMDDSVEELNSLLAANTALQESQSAGTLVPVRSRREANKDGKKEWEVVTPYGEIDFRGGNFTAEDVVRMLHLNRRIIGQKEEEVSGNESDAA